MMNRIILGLVFLLSCSGAVKAQEQNSEGMRFFEGTFEEANLYGLLRSVVRSVCPDGTVDLSLERGGRFLQ